MNDYILIEYSNSVDFGDILYQNTFENKIYLDADVSKPEYEIVEEGTENGDGEFFPTFQKWAKKYSITFYAQEFLVDALTLMTLHDQITVTLRNGEASNVLDAEVEYKWDSNIECWAEVTLSFVTDYIIRKKCDENQDTSCITAVCVADDVYDADDGGAGTARWLAPETYPGETSFFYISSAACGVYNAFGVGFMKSIDNVWTSIDLEVGEMGEVTGLTDPSWLVRVTDVQYNRMPYICSIVALGGGNIQVFADSDGVEDMFWQLQRVENPDPFPGDNLGSPQLATAFKLGYTIQAGVNTWKFRIHWYTHSCDYGYSNTVVLLVT